MKTKIIKTIAGAAVFFSFLSPVLVLAQSAEPGWSVENYGEAGLPQGTVVGIIENFMMWILGVLGIIGIIGFVISGIMYLTSAGDDTQAEKAKNAMKWSIVGIIVGLAGYVAIQAIDAALNAEEFF